MKQESRKQHDAAFKREAVRLASEPGVRDRTVERDRSVRRLLSTYIHPTHIHSDSPSLPLHCRPALR